MGFQTLYRWCSTAIMSGQFDLDRFVQAQNPVLAQVEEELRDGRKRSHWMWFVFPQLRGLGQSSMARQYAIASLAEARAYLRHPVLGPRLIKWTALVNAVKDRSAGQIFGSPDDRKFHSSMTLFSLADPDAMVFRQALGGFFDSEPDRLTAELVEGPKTNPT